MLGQLDTFIAFVVVILAVSLLITMLNQAVVAVASMRGLHLRSGIETLLAQVAPELKPHLREIANEVLHHPLISDSAFHSSDRFKLWQLATAIRVDEFKDILKRVADSDEAKQKWSALTDAVAKEAVWKDVDRWFDKTMDRVTQRFTVSTRWVTFAWAVAIAFIVHLDASTLFAQLSDNPEIRAKLLASTDLVENQAARLVNLQNGQIASADLRTTLDDAKLINAQLSSTGIHLMPDYSQHVAGWWPDDILPMREKAAGQPLEVNAHFFGVFFSAMLLSLGAPFWFNVLKQAATLRPVVGNLQQQERESQS